MLNGSASPAVAGSYFTGAFCGGTLTSAVLLVLSGLVSPVAPTGRAVILLAGLAILTVRAAGLVSFRLPQNGRQIPEHAFATSATRAAFRFAFELGTAARTYITKEAAYAAALALVFAAPQTLGRAVTACVLLAAGFAFGRSTVVVGAVWRKSVITGHPRWAQSSANFLTLAMVLVLALRLF